MQLIPSFPALECCKMDSMSGVVVVVCEPSEAVWHKLTVLYLVHGNE